VSLITISVTDKATLHLFGSGYTRLAEIFQTALE